MMRTCHEVGTLCTAVLCLFVTVQTAPTSQRSGPPASGSIPAIERFDTSDDLRVSLHLSDATVPIGETPVVTVRFRNAGREVMYLNPRQARMAHVVKRGASPGCTSHAHIASRAITVKDLVRLEPSQTWETRVLPGPTAESPTGLRPGFALSRGSHQIGFRYTNYPDCLFTKAVRMRAAQAIAQVDRHRARQLLLRELDSRLLGACVTANFNLGRLTGREQTFDCENPRARSEAKARWTEILQSFK
jgi:hypothetical protein